MTKRDYDIIARAVRMAWLEPQARNATVLSMCRELRKDNPNFKPYMFVKACGADVSVLLAI